MSWEARPEPREDVERAALLRALERALAERRGPAHGYATEWWRSGLADLGRSPAAEQLRGEPGIVEP